MVHIPYTRANDCNTNGISDATDIAAGTSRDCNTNDVPDECDIDATALAKLVGADTALGDELGTSVAIYGNTAVVGAPDDDDAGASSGSAYVFVRNGSVWTQQAKLVAADAAAGDSFGVSVAARGDTIIVGAPDDDDAGASSGSAYIFVRTDSAWTQQAKLTAMDAAAGDIFGYTVTVDGDTAVVGSYGDSDAGAASGSAYVFIRSGSVWSQQAKLVALDAAAFDNFGTSVALSGDSAVVGAYRNDHDGADSGSAYVFVRSGTSWTQQAKLVADDAAALDWFGFSVAVSGDTTVIGAYPNNAAYVFVRNGSVWSQQARLESDPGENFGNSVAIDGDQAVVGAQADHDLVDFGGSAYVFVQGNDGVWTKRAKLTAGADVEPYAYFGGSVAIDSGAVVVGAHWEDAVGGNSGAAYTFPTPASADCNTNGIPDECDITAGTSNDCNTNSVPDECELAAGAATDCNGNSVLDECDLALATSDDCNSNGVPDECDVDARQFAKLIPSDGEAGDWFGSSVAYSGDTVVVGAYGDDSAQGSVYVFVRDGDAWTFENKLVAEDGAAGDQFGIHVAINATESRIVVGAKDDDDAGSASGSAYVFARNGSVWTQEAKLVASDGAAGDQFGISVGISGLNAIIGANMDDTAAGVESGSAYVFIFDGLDWTEQAKLTASDAAAGDHFGISIAVDGQTAVIGADLDQIASDTPGSAYVFVQTGPSTWAQEAKLVASDGANGDRFGASVSVSGDTAVIGAYRDDNATYDNGAAYVFVRNASVWTQEAKLVAMDTAPTDRLGTSVSVSGDTVVAGTYFDDDNGGDSGSAYLFVRDDSVWSQRAKLLAADGAQEDYFGYSVAVRGDSVVVGAFRALAAYLFPVPFSADCNANGAPDDCDLSAGTSTDCDSNSVPDECDIASAFGEDCNGTGALDACEVASGSASDCDHNNVPDECDVAAGLDCNTNGVPDNCDVTGATSLDLNLNNRPDECDSRDCNSNGVPDNCDRNCNDLDLTGSNMLCMTVFPDDCGTSEDCNANDIPDECDVAAGTSQDCDGDQVLDECGPPPPLEDCNGNSVHDGCDIMAGTSADCNLNGVPDDCDIAGGTSDDCAPLFPNNNCNGDGIPDECCPAAPSADFDGNGHVDLIDYAAIQDCAGIVAGASSHETTLSPMPPPLLQTTFDGLHCGCLDINQDGYVDELDVGLMVDALTGP